MVANLPYSVATPLILRTIEELPSICALDGDGPARDRRPAAGRAGQPHLRLAQRASPSSPARWSWSRTVDPAVFRPRPRVDSAILGAAPHRAGRRRRRPGSWSAPPSPTAASRWPARSSTSGPARSPPPGPRSPSSACREDARAEALSPAAISPPSPRSCNLPPEVRPMARSTPQPSSTSASTSARAARDGLHELCSLFEPLALADLIEVDGGGARRGRLPGRRGREPGGARRWPRCASGAGSARRCGSRSRSGCRSRPASAAAAPTPPRCCACAAGEVADLEELAAGARRRRPLAAAPVAGAGPRRRRAGRAAAGARRRTRSSCCPAAAGWHRRGLRRGRPARARPRRRASSRRWRRACARRPAPAPRRSPTPSCSSTTSSPRRARCAPRSATRSRRCAPPARRWRC